MMMPLNKEGHAVLSPHPFCEPGLGGWAGHFGFGTEKTVNGVSLAPLSGATGQKQSSVLTRAKKHSPSAMRESCYWTTCELLDIFTAFYTERQTSGLEVCADGWDQLYGPWQCGWSSLQTYGLCQITFHRNDIVAKQSMLITRWIPRNIVLMPSQPSSKS